MRTILRSLATLLVVCVLPGAVFGQEPNAALAASLTKQEQLLGSSTPPTETEVAALERLVAELRKSGDATLISRGELALALLKDRRSSARERNAEDRAISKEARTIRGYRWRRAKSVLVKSGFWVGLTSAGLFGVSEAIKSWATQRYLDTPTLGGGKPYFITGQVSELTANVAAIGALSGLGLAWLLAIEPFDLPRPPSGGVAVEYPRLDMTASQKISYLDGLRKDYVRKEQRALGVRKTSFAFFAAGLTGVIATAFTGYLGNLEYQKYLSSTSAQSSTSHLQAVAIYQDVAIGTASLGLAGLTGAMIGYLVGPEPQQYEASIQVLDQQLALLRQGG